MFVLEKDDPKLFFRVQEQNLNRKYELLTNCIEVGLPRGPLSFDKYLLWSLNHVAAANISQLGGMFGQEPVYAGNHTPPNFIEVDDLIDRFITVVQENWLIWSPTELAAYGLWRMNWIHPFVEGNGRTARAICYFLLCVRVGSLLRGRKILPERIRENRDGYVIAPRAEDKAWNDGNLDFNEMERYLAALVLAQLSET